MWLTLASDPMHIIHNHPKKETNNHKATTDATTIVGVYKASQHKNRPELHLKNVIKREAQTAQKIYKSTSWSGINKKKAQNKQEISQ